MSELLTGVVPVVRDYVLPLDIRCLLAAEYRTCVRVRGVDTFAAPIFAILILPVESLLE